MQFIRNLSLALAVLLIASCTRYTDETGPNLSRHAQWGILPMLNYSQTPQAGERSEQILLSAISSHGVQPRVYPVNTDDELVLIDDNERLAGAMDWARAEKLDYVLTGSIEEWQYKSGLDGEPAVGISLRVVEVSSGRVLWSKSGARAGWSRESLAGTAQQVIETLVSALRFE